MYWIGYVYIMTLQPYFLFMIGQFDYFLRLIT